MNWLDIQLQLNGAATLTSAAGNVVFASALNQSTIYGHVENQGDAVGLFIPFSAVTISGSQTYQFQVLTDSNVNMTTTEIVVADTGTMTTTDGRLTGPMSYIFLPIQFGTVLQQYVGARYTFANSPSITIGGAWLTSWSSIQNFYGYPNNYAL